MPFSVCIPLLVSKYIFISVLNIMSGDSVAHDMIRESSERSVDPAVANLQGTATDMQETMGNPRSSAFAFRHRLVGSHAQACKSSRDRRAQL